MSASEHAVSHLRKTVLEYSAAILFASLGLFFNGIHFLTEVVYKVESNTFGYWLNTTAENLQSECWQVALAAWGFKHFRWKGTPDEKENADQNRRVILWPLVVAVLFVVALFFI